MSQAEQRSRDADQRVRNWPSLNREPTTPAPDLPTGVSKCDSGGFLVDVGEAFPAWRADMGAVRRLLLARDLITAELGGHP